MYINHTDQSVPYTLPLGMVFVYKITKAVWTSTQILEIAQVFSSDKYILASGYALALSPAGTQLAVGAPLSNKDGM